MSNALVHRLGLSLLGLVVMLPTSLLQAEQACAQEPGRKPTMTVFTWECSRSFTPHTSSRDLNEVLNAAFDLKSRSLNYFLAQQLGSAPEESTAWSSVFRLQTTPADSDDHDYLVYEKVNDKWERVAIVSKIADATALVQSMESSQRTAMIVTRYRPTRAAANADSSENP